jgi:hypothetical protein
MLESVDHQLGDDQSKADRRINDGATRITRTIDR